MRFSFCTKQTLESKVSSKASTSAMSQWKFAQWFHNSLEGCKNICTSEKHVNKEKTVNEPMFARLVGGTTQWPIAKSLPVLNSPFNPSTWRTSLHDFSDLSFTDDLIYDIEHGRCIRYTGPRTSRISPKHLSAIWNITSTALELECELGLGQDRPITHPFRQKFCQIADRCYSQKAFETR